MNSDTSFIKQSYCKISSHRKDADNGKGYFVCHPSSTVTKIGGK